MTEDVLGKAYDSRLMKRLLKYAKPYWKLLSISIILLIFITGLELLNPYLIKVAIDDHLNGINKPLIELGIDSSLVGVEFDGKKYVREDSLDKKTLEDLNDFPRKHIIKESKEYYLVPLNNKDILSGNKLDAESYRNFRAIDIEGINRTAFIFAFVILFTFIISYLQTYILNYTSQKIIFNIREEVYNHILNLSVGYFDRSSVGRLVTRVTNDTETLNEMYTSVLVNLFKDIFILVGIFFVMINMNLRLAMFSFLLTPFILIISMIFGRHIRDVYRLGRTQLAKINSSLNEYISGIRIIQIYKKENKISREFDKINRDYLRTIKKEISIFSIFRPLIEIIRSLGIASLIYLGGKQVLNNVIDFGVLYAFIIYLQKFFEPILDLTEKYNILQSAMASSERIFAVLDDQSIIKDSSAPYNLKMVNGKIEFKNVWFAYNDEDWVLKDISFTINPGENVAFVGATGAGKSSIINLITRFYDIQKGEILIDGINIKDIPKAELRKHIGVVLQDVFLFTGTIEDNIRLNNEDIGMDKIMEIAKYVNAHHFIEKLPRKYKEPVMERGSTLSSGERQLLAFARTLVYDPKILILDEATSNIDTETEILIQDALSKLIKNRTSIAVAHRLSTIQHSDKIYVLNNGVIQESGNHQELLDEQGIYFDLYTLQYKESLSLQ